MALADRKVLILAADDFEDMELLYPLYRLREEDATGQGRLLVVDRNWTTTAQNVEAGSQVPCDTVIVLSAKKTGD